MEIDNKKMKLITGGSVTAEAALIGGGIVALIIGIISGYTNPTKCNN